MREITAWELINILKNNLNYILELSILQEPQLCVKPVHKFERAFADNGHFCMIYSEADDPEFMCASYNSSKFEEILQDYNLSKIIFHDASGDCESFYHNGSSEEPLKNKGQHFLLNIRHLTLRDKLIAYKYKKEEPYLKIIFEDFIERKIWRDCGIIGTFSQDYDFLIGYLAYYELAENIRDVAYIYVKKDSRGLDYAKVLLKYFKNKNIRENKISYYSYAENEASAKLAKSCGFLSCSKRYER